MKRIFFLLLAIILTSALVSAQQKTLISDEYKDAGFLALSLSSAPIKGTSGMMLGGEATWIINRSFFMGAVLEGLVSNYPASRFDPANTGDLVYSFGGIKIGAVRNSDEMIHPVTHLLIGLGTVEYNLFGSVTAKRSTILVFRPGVDLEVNIASIFRLAIGASYRLVSGVDNMPGLSNQDLNGMSVGLTLKWGGFDDQNNPIR